MKYQCLNCDKLFIYPAIMTRKNVLTLVEHRPEPHDDLYGDGNLEWRVCPYCQSKDIEEYTPEPLPQTVEEIANVYIYDLTTGAQTALDQLLAQGYRIVNRYSKQYHLEKPKTAPVDATPTEAPKA